MAFVTVFESWVRHWSWYSYAIQHRDFVPYLLVDRSQCTDPFFDHFAPIESARPLISGLCRPRKNFPLGERFVYLARIDPRVLAHLGRTAPDGSGPVYLGVAELVVEMVHASHAAAAETFERRRYAALPNLTSYPPNLTLADNPAESVSRECCIVHDEDDPRKRAHTPDTSTDVLHLIQYEAYYTRSLGLPVAECRFGTYGDRFALNLNPMTAPLLRANDWGGKQMNTRGIRIDSEVADRLGQKIANAR